MNSTRRTFAKTIAAGLAATQARAQSGRPKNILWLMSDQHRPHALGIDGNPVARTPNLDALAKYRNALRSGLLLESRLRPLARLAPDRTLFPQPRRQQQRAPPVLPPQDHRASPRTRRIHDWPHRQNAFRRRARLTASTITSISTTGFNTSDPRASSLPTNWASATPAPAIPQIDDLWRDFGDPWSGVSRGRRTTRPRWPVGTCVEAHEEQDNYESFVTRESVRFLKNHSRERPVLPDRLLSQAARTRSCRQQRFYNMFRAVDMQVPGHLGQSGSRHRAQRGSRIDHQ